MKESNDNDYSTSVCPLINKSRFVAFRGVPFRIPPAGWMWGWMMQRQDTIVMCIFV
jgi:hypothetical protein